MAPLALWRSALALCATAVAAARTREPPELPVELARHALGFVPGVPLVAVALGEEPTTLRRGAGVPQALAGAGTVVDAKFFPAGDRLVTAGADGSVVIWCARSGRVIRTLHWGRDGVVAALQVEVFPDGDRVIGLGLGHGAVIWSASSGRLLHGTWWHHRAMRVFSQGDRVVSGLSWFWDEPAIIWHADTGRTLHLLTQPRDSIRHLELSLCGAKVVTAGARSAYVWDAASGALDAELARRMDWISGVAISQGGSQVAVGSLGGGAMVFSGATGELARAIHTDYGVLAVAFVEGGRRLVVFFNMQAVVLDVASGRHLRSLTSGSEGVAEVQRVSVSADGFVVAACGAAPSRRDWAGQRVVVWDTTTGQRLVDANSSAAPHGLSKPKCSVALGPPSPLLTFEAW